MVPRKILIDCDPGHDDAMALLLAHGSPAVDLLGITTVGGNQTLEKVTRNARIIATICGMTDVPIAAGSPVGRTNGTIRTAGNIHGETGLDGTVLPVPTVPLDPRHGVDLIIETVLAHQPGTVTLVPMAPLTNIALALRREPAIIERFAEVVPTGGGYGRGNITPVAEVNIAVDPEAAQAVFAAPWKVTMVGFDLAHQTLATPSVRQRFSAIGTPVGEFVGGILDFFRESYVVDQGMDAPPVHDPCAVARVIDPAVMTVRPAHVEVEPAGADTTGMTVCDVRGRTGPTDTDVAVTLDVDRFWDLMVDAVAAIDPIPTGGRS